MLLRISVLLVLLQCGSKDIVPEEIMDIDATYMRFVPGAGGGRGIVFKVRSGDVMTGLEIDKFEVNGIEVPAVVHYEAGTTLIEATMFYADPEIMEGHENPDPIDPVLYQQENYSAIIHFTASGESGTLEVKDFEEVESPMFQ